MKAHGTKMFRLCHAESKLSWDNDWFVRLRILIVLPRAPHGPRRSQRNRLAQFVEVQFFTLLMENCAVFVASDSVVILSAMTCCFCEEISLQLVHTLPSKK